MNSDEYKALADELLNGSGVDTAGINARVALMDRASAALREAAHLAAERDSRAHRLAAAEDVNEHFKRRAEFAERDRQNMVDDVYAALRGQPNPANGKRWRERAEKAEAVIGQLRSILGRSGWPDDLVAGARHALSTYDVEAP